MSSVLDSLSSTSTSSTSADTFPASSPALLHSQTVARDRFSSVLDEIIESFVIKLKRREIRGSGLVAIQTAELLRSVISKKKFNTVSEILALVRSIGRVLTNAHYIELSIGNVVRRVLFIIRHEAAAIASAGNNPNNSNSDSTSNSQTSAGGVNTQTGGFNDESSSGSSSLISTQLDLSLSLHKLLDQQQFDSSETAGFAGSSAAGSGFSATGNLDQTHLDQKQLLKLKPAVLELIGELIEEIKTAELLIAEQAVEHIYAKEVILTFGMSRTVVAFLCDAAKIRKFEVVVSESAPSYEGHKMALQLAEAGIETTVITDSAVWAMMPSINKVIVGTHAVMANGGLIAHSGAQNIASAAKYHSVPFVVLTGLHKLSPLYAFDPDTFNEHSSPAQLLDFAGDWIDRVHPENPHYDYITPDLVTLFITNDRGHNPSYIYRLLAEYYNPADYQL